MSVIVAITAPIPVNIGVNIPPISQPTQTNISEIIIKKTVDFIIKTSYNISMEVAPSFPGGFLTVYRFRFGLRRFRGRFFFLPFMFTINAIVAIVQLQRLKKIENQSLSSNLSPPLLYCIYYNIVQAVCQAFLKNNLRFFAFFIEKELFA